MTINNNLMNPVPLWTSKNDWYCKKATNHGNCVPPVFPTGMMPKMALTVVGAPNSASRSITLTQDSGMPSTYLRTYSGYINPNPKNQNSFGGVLGPGEHHGEEPLILITNNNGVCSVKFKYWYSGSQVGYRTRTVYLYDDGAHRPQGQAVPLYGRPVLRFAGGKHRLGIVGAAGERDGLLLGGRIDCNQICLRAVAA